MAIAAAGPHETESLHLRSTRPLEELAFDGWLVRRARNDVKRARSVNVVAGSTLPLEEKVDHCERLYAEAGLPCLFRLTSFGAPEGLDPLLAARGYQLIDQTLQQVASLERLTVPGASGVRIEALPLGAWLPVASTLRGLTPAAEAAEQRRLAHSALTLTGAIAYLDATPIACGLLALDGVFAALMDIHVTADRRGRGVGTAVTAWLLDHARSRGAEIAWLNVLASNEPAIRTYSRLGFSTLYEYWYRLKSET